jgi:uncharacterized protein YjiS (DUF1127 family)
MTTRISITAGSDGPRPSIRAAGRLLHAWRRRWPTRRTIGTLQGLSDSQLRDIGLHRSEIPHRLRD